MKKEVKSQAALEFLTTYAWAFLVILIVIAALYYFGIFDFSKFLEQKCSFPSQFECLDFVFKGDDPYGQANDEIRFKLVNGIGENLMITALDINDDATPALSCTSANPTPDYPWDSGLEQEFIFSGCSGGAFINGERTEAKITITYYAPATTGWPTHEIKGKITAVVISP